MTRGAVGSNQYQQRGASSPPAGRRHLAAVVNAVNGPPTGPTGRVRIYPQYSGVPRHAVDVHADGRVEFVSCDGCDNCEARREKYEELLATGVSPLVAASCVHGNTETQDNRDLICRGWHDRCGCGAPPPSFAEIAPWAACGSMRHTLSLQSLESGVDATALFDAGLNNPVQWFRAGLTADEAVAWHESGFEDAASEDFRAFRSQKMTPDEAAAWMRRAGPSVPSVHRSQWIRSFPDPDQAVRWSAAFETSLKKDDGWGAHAGIAASLHKNGIVAEDLGDWFGLSSDLDTATLWAQTSGYDLDSARRLKKAFRGAKAAFAAVTLSGSVESALEWAGVKITKKDDLERAINSGLTPAAVAEARVSGETAVPVDCNGSMHTVRVVWKDAKPTWESHDHDSELDNAAAAFGAEDPNCNVLLRYAQTIWNGGRGAATPGSALRAGIGTTTQDARWKL